VFAKIISISDGGDAIFRVAKWWLPDDVVFVDELPHTATGKVSKRALRERFAPETAS